MNRPLSFSVCNQEVKPRSGLARLRLCTSGGRNRRGAPGAVDERKRQAESNKSAGNKKKSQVLKGFTRKSLRGAHEVTANDGLQLAATLGLEDVLKSDLNEQDFVYTRVGRDKAVDFGKQVGGQPESRCDFFFFFHLTNPLTVFTM